MGSNHTYAVSGSRAERNVGKRVPLGAVLGGEPRGVKGLRVREDGGISVQARGYDHDGPAPFGNLVAG